MNTATATNAPALNTTVTWYRLGAAGRTTRTGTVEAIDGTRALIIDADTEAAAWVPIDRIV